MSVTVAVTVTIPNATAASIVATGASFTQAIGPEVIRLVKRQFVESTGTSDAALGAVTAATVVT